MKENKSFAFEMLKLSDIYLFICIQCLFFQPIKKKDDCRIWKLAYWILFKKLDLSLTSFFNLNASFSLGQVAFQLFSSKASLNLKHAVSVLSFHSINWKSRSIKQENSDTDFFSFRKVTKIAKDRGKKRDFSVYFRQKNLGYFITVDFNPSVLNSE